jgi:rubrerythrin
MEVEGMDLKKAFGVAMKGEIEGRELYKAAADRPDDSKAREMFKFLAEEENRHFETLKSMYDSHSKNSKIQVPDMPRIVRFDDAKSPIFSRDFKRRIGEKHFEMSALSLALRLEHDSIQYYTKVAEEVGNSELKDFFTELSNWERDHYDALYAEISYLEEEYFNENNFEPF